MPKRTMNPVDAYVGARLRMQRVLLGMSQEKLGELLGVTFQQVQKYEKGTNRIGASRLFDVAAVLEVPIQYFFDGLAVGGGPGLNPEGLVQEGRWAIESVNTPEGLELNRAFSRIANRQLRRRFVELIGEVAGTD